MCFTESFEKIFDMELNTQFCPKNIVKTCVFIFEQMIHKIVRAISSKIKIRVLATFLGQKSFDIEQNTQFSSKNFQTRVLIFEQTALNVLRAICSKIKTPVFPTFLGQNCVF